MDVFVTGASGHIGEAVVRELLEAGHRVTGLARSDRGARIVEEAGARVRRGDLDDLGGLRQAASEFDGVVHLAFKHDDLARPGGMADAADDDLRVIEALGQGLEQTGKPLVATSPIMLLAASGRLQPPFTEDDTLEGGPRIDSENAAIALAGRGVRASVVRLPPTVHGDRDRDIGFIPTLVRAAREIGASGYVGDGSNRWPAAHTTDVARLYRLALEHAPAGTRLHAAAEEGVALRVIAEAIGAGLGVPTERIGDEEALARFGFVGRFTGLDGAASSGRTRALVGWAPSGCGLIADIADGSYLTR